MSMVRCERCDNPIDSDLDVDCFCQCIAYGDDGATDDIILCLSCRNKLEAQADMEREP